jgi:hypothetical protein
MSARNRSDIPDIVGLVRRINRLEKLIASTKDKSARLTKMRQQIVFETCEVALQNKARLDRLHSSEQVTEKYDQIQESDHASTNLKEAIDASFLENKGSLQAVGKELDPVMMAAKSAQSIESTHGPSMRDNTGMDNKENADADSSFLNVTISEVPLEAFKPSETFFSMEEFNQVPVSIRGRCKYENCMALLNRLYTHAQEVYAEKPKKSKSKSKQALRKTSFLGTKKEELTNPATMTIASLDAAGFKVAGKTGTCLIQTLKHMDLIHVEKNGLGLRAKNVRLR